MNRVIRCALAATTFSLAAFGAHAQRPSATAVESLGEKTVPWTVAISPSATTVAVGNCQLVYIDLTDETGKDRPRRPGGMRVSLADFDWSASGEQPGAAVGKYDGPNSWSVCACQGAVVGSLITITATYPAASLPDKVRVPGLAFRSTTHLPIHAPYGTSNPAGCDAAPVAPVVVAVGTLAPPTMASVNGRTLPPSAIPITTPTGARPVGTTNPTGAIPPSGTAAPPATPAPAGPPPNLVDVTGNPAEAVVTWSAPYSTNGPVTVEYLVDRVPYSVGQVGAAQSPVLSTREWHDTNVLSGSWIYRVTAIYADGRRGTAGALYTYVEPKTLQDVRAEQVGRDSVSITWSPVTGAAYYAVTGPPTMSTVRADSAHVVLPGIPLGTQTWQVSAVYTGKGASPAVRSGPATTVSVEFVRRRYRLVAEALRVTTETADQQFSADGKYDEVFVIARGERINRQSGARIDLSPIQVSAVHGDISNWPPPQRVKAGTASGWGGIQHGNVVSPIWSAPSASAPMGTSTFVLWEGELIGGKQDLLLHPMVFEVDEPEYDKSREIPPDYAICNGTPCVWNRYFAGSGGGGYAHAPAKAAMSAPQITVFDGDQMFLTGSGYFVHLENQDRDRPIGLTVEDRAEQNVGLVGMWRDKGVALSREKIEAALASGQNKIEVRFWDHWNKTGMPLSTVNYLNGDYTLVIRMERAP